MTKCNALVSHAVLSALSLAMASRDEYVPRPPSSMKRPANAAQLSSDNPRPFKAIRTLDVAEYFNDANFEVPWVDIPDVVTDSGEGADEEPGWIIGKIFMRWAQARDPKIVIKDTSNKELEIKFTKANMEEPKMKKLGLGINDTVKISLRNAQVDMKRGGSSSSKMPFSLKFLGDVAVMCVLKHGNSEWDGTVVDTHSAYTCIILEIYSNVSSC